MGGGFLEQIKVRLMEELQTPVAFTIPLFGGIPVTLSVVVSWLVMGALILAAALGTRRLKLRDPGKPQLCLEMAVEFLNGFTKNNMGAHGPDFAPYLGTISLYILLCNIIGIFGLVPPDQGPERHGGTGHHERGADLWGTVSVPRAAGRAEKIYGAHAPAAAHQPDGGRDPAPGPVYAAVRQHPGGRSSSWS